MVYGAGVTGGRDYAPTREDLLRFAILVDEYYQVQHVFTGNCPTGVDAAVKRYRLRQGRSHFGVDAAWLALGHSAGPKRNGWLLDVLLCLPSCVLIAFPGGRGTRDCIAQAAARGIPVVYIREEA